MPDTGKPILSTMETKLVGRNDLADARFNLIEQGGCFLDASADGRADMQADLACIHRRKEIPSQETAPAGATEVQRPESPTAKMPRLAIAKVR